MRLDVFVSEKTGVSRTRAQNIIKTGGVKVNGVVLEKPSADIYPEKDEVIVTDTLKYSSLGGLKMENAIERFSVSVEGKNCLDIGAANGGFTDCLLKKGAMCVSALDLNVAFSDELRNHPRVKIFDKTNVKTIGSLFSKESFDFICVDLSFISLCSVIPLLYPTLKRDGNLLVLFKPQFEVGRASLPKSGVVRDSRAIERALVAVVESAKVAGFHLIGDCPIPEVFPEKNKERTLLFIKQ